jgi:hypothetical protein
MASKDIINPVDVNNPSKTRRSADLLPGYLRTDKNTKFLASTLDQLIQQPQLERISGFIGDKLGPTYNPKKDLYIDSGTKLRNDYQLVPSMVIRDMDNNLKSVSGYDDLINQLSFSNADVSNLSRLFSPQSYSYDPLIDWDKFVNYREYYWVPTGPDSIEVTGHVKATQSTYTVTDASDKSCLLFNPDGLTPNPLLELYRGMTYVFNVTSDFPFYIKTAYTRGTGDLYSGARGNGTTQVILTVDDFTPKILFYFAEGNDNAIGQFSIKQLAEDTILDVDLEIVGKETFVSGNGIAFSNGMKVHFTGSITPEIYQGKEFIVEGVGTAITLVPYDSLTTNGFEVNNLDTNFDATPFDKYPFDDFRYVPLVPEYVTINRAADDKNPWSRYNRWVHKDVIAATAKANGVQEVYEVNYRANRPIIEFTPGIRLYNFGVTAKTNIDLIDNITTSAFKSVEGATGFYIDGILLEQGFRVIFNADSDYLVKGRIYEVRFVTINNEQVINLEETSDSVPSTDDAIVTNRGLTIAGNNWWYNGSEWVNAQQKTVLNQAPLFEAFDDSQNKWSDQTIYNSSFVGTKIFGYSAGTVYDKVLGFNIKYKSVENFGEILFDNYFMTDTFTVFDQGSINTYNVADAYVHVNHLGNYYYRNVWTKSVDKPIPILQSQVIDSAVNYVEITSIYHPGLTNDLSVDLFINDQKKILNVDYYTISDVERAYVVSRSGFSSNDRVLLKLYTSKTPIGVGYYELPINLTNNPLNGPISNFTFTEISDHVKTIVENNDNFAGVFPGLGNLRDLADSSAYGSRLVSHTNPIGFAHYFLGTPENNIIDSIRKVSYDYNQFKTSLIKAITELNGSFTPAVSLNLALKSLNVNKDVSFPYSYSDMLAYGNNYKARTYTVSNSRVVRYSLANIFDDTVLSERAILVYLTSVSDTTQTPKLLCKGYDYLLESYDPSITINISLAKGDTITILDYPSTVGTYIPPTPTKLGLYPKFKPSIFVDSSYTSGPRTVIQGHDGSITLAFDDYRDDILLEYEYRVYNNLKVSYNPDLINIDSIMPGAFKDNEYSLSEVTALLTPDFLRWVGFFGVDFTSNSNFDETDPFTFNYSGNIDVLTNSQLPGHWRGIYKYYYGTDRPHSHPWEMLGFSEKPDWWDSMYGPAPYTNGNNILWQDIESGTIAQGNRAGTYTLYARPGLSGILPVDDMGDILDPTASGLAITPVYDPTDPRSLVVLRSESIATNWIFGDQGPAETAWRKSSIWPYITQILWALTKPATYASVLFDTSRMKLNAAGQYKYGIDEIFLNPSLVSIYRDTDSDGNRILAAGYSVFAIETGLMKNSNYITDLKYDLAGLNYNLMSKLGGFASKDKLQITIDAIDPTSPNPGVLVPTEDYNIIFNSSTPIISLSISGLIVQKTPIGFTLRGYDKYKPYFTILKPITNASDREVNIGGVSQGYLIWTANTTYNAGQIVFYNDRYYQAVQRHNSDSTFDASYYQSLPALPVSGGVSVIGRTAFDTDETTISYGTEFTTLQDVYDVIVGYGRWLQSRGFVFEEYNTDLGQVLDWNFSAREFLYWTTQNWAVNAIITISPFANKLTVRSSQGILDNVLNNFYEYSLLKADGGAFDKNNFTIVRLDGEASITTVNTKEGLFFARLNLVQKEHVIIFNNLTLFQDIVYDIETGYRQHRVNLKGFRTSNWNGDFFSPGFIFDSGKINEWFKFTDYKIGQVVKFSGKYYSAPKSLIGSETFNISDWVLLPEKVTPQLLPNFDYKINQFEDFYSLDIDNFDAGQQAAAQHLTGYTPRPYLNYIIGDPIAQYKFYQGFIREKGTKNPLTKLSKTTLNNFQSSIDFNEEWAFRIGYYGGYTTFQELETPLESTKFHENPQVINFVESKPTSSTSPIYYKDEADLIIKPEDYDINSTFPISSLSYDELFKLPVAGYVRIDDVSMTKANMADVMAITDPASMKEGDTIWLGFKENGDWDVIRNTQIPTNIIAVDIYIPGEKLSVITYYPHQLSIGNLVSISRVDSNIDGCFTVLEILSPHEFLVSTTLMDLPATTGSAVSGLLYIFKSSRLSTLDGLAHIPFLDRWEYDEKVWVDDNGTGKWAVYKKTDNYTSIAYSTGISNVGQHFGTKIYTNDNTDKLLISASDYKDTTTGYKGRVFILIKNGTETPILLFSYTLNDSIGAYYLGSGDTGLGNNIIFDGDLNLSIASAPIVNNVKSSVVSNVAVCTPSALSSNHKSQGVVKLSILDYTNSTEVGQVVITSPHPTDYSLFGISFVASASTSSKTLLVGSPGDNSGRGAVYSYTVSATTSSISVNASLYIKMNQPSLIDGSLFGSAIAANSDLSRVAVSATGYGSSANNRVGAVYIYNYSVSTSSVQTIVGDSTVFPNKFLAGENFGKTLQMSKDGSYLMIGSPAAVDLVRGTKSGVVDIFTWNSVLGQYEYLQRLHAPISTNDVTFGYDMSIDSSNQTLVITSLGNSKTTNTSFDKYSERLINALSLKGSRYVNDSTSSEKKVKTTFDSNSTRFYSRIANAGAAHSYSKNASGKLFAHSQELFSQDVVSDSYYGQSVLVTDSSVYVSAPGNISYKSNNNGQVFIFNKIDSTVNGWQEYRSQEDLVDLSLIKRAITIDSTTDQLQDYLDIIDPVKGKLFGIVEQELKYMTDFDPAVYSIGTDNLNVNADANWTDTHVGELWWDLSTAKYVWYEQGELEYRKNNWNQLFPGSSVDVYEWVASSVPPSKWSQLADTAAGLTAGVSGTPKFVDDSVVSTRQIYSTVSNSFSTAYYFWVKNKSIVPDLAKNRRISAASVAQIITDPINSGIKFLAVLSSSAAMVANIKPSITSDLINLNINLDLITDAANRHTEWLLIEENDPRGINNAMLTKKMVESLIGYDSLGNPVPDPALPEKLKYGIGIRPRQSMFKDRNAALRNLIEYTNEIVSGLLLVGNVSFDNLNAKDEIPPASTYDTLVEDIFGLELIATKLLSPAELTAVLDGNGKILRVIVTSQGFGYLTSPTITILGDGIGAELTANIDEQGKVIEVIVNNPGSGFTATPELTVRPFTAVVQTDSTINGKWAIYQWNKSKFIWIKVQTQDYDTTAFWKYIDWVSPEYNPATPLSYTVSEVYVLQELQTIQTGSYVKVLNGGLGFYYILRKTDGSGGTFDSDWDLLYVEKGTVQFSDSLWNPTSLSYAWDQKVGFDQTEYDQSSITEVSYGIQAIIQDIFSGPLDIYNNKLFFKAVRYALSEQQFIDWAFKTTFISVTNNAGMLDQRPTYKLQTSGYYEDFLKEIKPYHTKIRKFKELYTSTDYTASFTSDFDLPSYFSTSTLNFETVSFGNDRLTRYPWKSWYNNYAYSIESIIIENGGSGYTEIPLVEIITAPNDTGRGATAVAYIAAGKISNIIITNPGQGYTATPTVIINGGGNTDLSQARAYAQLGNSVIRNMGITLKFDRVISYDSTGTVRKEVGSKYFTDTFTADGENLSFDMTWVPISNKELITLTINNVLQLVDSYTITFNDSIYKPQANTSYTKKYAVLKLSFVPNAGDIVAITYPKSLDLYTAADRIVDYYKPMSGMPGNELSQLMTGITFPGLIIDTLPFNYSGGWDTIPWSASSWDNYSQETGYYAFSTTATSTQTFVIPEIIPAGTNVNVYINDSRIDSVPYSGVLTLIGNGAGVVDYIQINSPGYGYTAGKVIVTISAPNAVGGVSAAGTASVDSEGRLTAIVVDDLHRGSGYTEAPVVTITGNSSVQAYATAFLRAQYTVVSSPTVLNSVTIPSTNFVSSSSLVVFRYSTSDGTVLPTDEDLLDSVINGGSIEGGQLRNALGLTPTEIILDGDGFLTTYNSPAPEEHLPGQIQESVGINVYTQPTVSSPVISTKKYWSDGATRTFKLGVKPSNESSVIVTLNNVKLNSSDYTIDFVENTITLATTTPDQGWLSATSMSLGSIALLDYYITTTNSTATVFLSSVKFADVGSVYITIDGQPYNGYSLTSYRTRARLSIPQFGTIQAYLFRGQTKSFSEVVEQITNITTATTNKKVIGLGQPPGVSAPFHSQAIVTKNGLRLSPPLTTYYQVENGQNVFDISKSTLYPKRRIGLQSIEVYVNGVESPARNWNLDQPNAQVRFSGSVVANGDVVAIVVKQGHDYLIQNSQVVLTTAAQANDVIRITTFTNHDPDFIRTERYQGHSTNEYIMQRATLSSSYVWVAYNGVPLTADQDYRVEPDGITVVVRPGLYKSPSDNVVITSFANLVATDTIGYKIFKDILGRTQFKRLSYQNTTVLAQDLAMTATSINVVDAAVLTYPNVKFNLPGVVFVGRERIEFFQINTFTNTLSQLRRGTMGTTPLTVYSTGTEVLDQGRDQTIPFMEVLQSTSTVITTTTQKTLSLTGYVTFNTSTDFSNQVEVLYGGRRLLKQGISTVVHDFDAAYDTTSTADTIVEPEFSVNTSTLTLNFEPSVGTKLEVFRRTSKIWYEPGSASTLGENNTVQAKFLIARPAKLPQGTAPFSGDTGDLRIVLETGEYLLDENGVPLEEGL